MSRQKKKSQRLCRWIPAVRKKRQRNGRRVNLIWNSVLAQSSVSTSAITIISLEMGHHCGHRRKSLPKRTWNPKCSSTAPVRRPEKTRPKRFIPSTSTLTFIPLSSRRIRPENTFPVSRFCFSTLQRFHLLIKYPGAPPIKVFPNELPSLTGNFARNFFTRHKIFQDLPSLSLKVFHLLISWDSNDLF